MLWSILKFSDFVYRKYTQKHKQMYSLNLGPLCIAALSKGIIPLFSIFYSCSLFYSWWNISWQAVCVWMSNWVDHTFTIICSKTNSKRYFTQCQPRDTLKTFQLTRGKIYIWFQFNFIYFLLKWLKSQQRCPFVFWKCIFALMGRFSQLSLSGFQRKLVILK